MTAKGTSLQVTQAQELVQRLALVDDNNAAINLTGQQITVMITDKPGDPNPALVTKDSFSIGGVAIVNPATAGLIDVTFYPGDTSTRAPGVYYYDVWLDDGAGNQRPATLVATFTVLTRATRLPSAAATRIDNGSLTLAPLGSTVIGPYTIDPSQVAWIGVRPVNAAAGVQHAADGGTVPGAEGITWVEEETANNNEITFRATNKSSSRSLSTQWGVFVQ